MTTPATISAHIEAGGFDKTFAYLYPPAQLETQKQRYTEALRQFGTLFGTEREVALFSAPGRTEVGGNHTDHQRGRVLAAAVNLDILCTVSKNNDNIIRVKSKGYDQDDVDLTQLEKQDKENNKAIALLRGVAARFRELGHKVGGFDAYTTSDVLKGSGLSSSAAYEVAIGTILNHLFNGGEISAVEIAQIGQYAENVYFGKPSGLMDQTASSVGGFVTIDFNDPAHPVVEPVVFDLHSCGYTLCIVDTKGNHADLTFEYAAITEEMRSVAEMFGAQYLREVDESSFYERLPEVRAKTGDRAVLRAMHFFSDNQRVAQQVAALRAGDFNRFRQLIIESGHSSFTCLQNVFSCTQPQEQGLSVGLAISEQLLAPIGAWRVHGGGFAGTIQAFVPDEMLHLYKAFVEKVFGEGSCYELMIRPVGGVAVEPGTGGKN